MVLMGAARWRKEAGVRCRVVDWLQNATGLAMTIPSSVRTRRRPREVVNGEEVPDMSNDTPGKKSMAGTQVASLI